MARQNINVGTLANDGTGDSLRQTGNKINANLIELYDHLGSTAGQLPTTTTITANSTLSITHKTYILNKATALAVTLPVGVVAGDIKIFINVGTGVATVSANLAGTTTSFALSQYEGCQVVWSGTEWYLIGNQSVVTLA